MDNPLVPASYDIVWTIVTLAIFAAIVVAVAVMVRRSRKHRAEVATLRAEVDAIKARDTA